MRVRTVFVCAHRDGVAGWSVADAGAGEHPHPVLGPPLELVQHDGGVVVDSGGGSIAVRATGFDQVELVVDNSSVGALGRRGLPRDADSSR